ncbi:MAG: vanadium-dependent haloperoxidase, partial [Opitutales bacterium]
GARHQNTLGTNDGTGYDLNPVTGEPYAPNLVLRADYGRILAEFWADGPDSETPPGHWNAIANTVSDHPLFERRFEGKGPLIDPLEWDVKIYFALNAALSDAAIACWDAKRKYDYARPITMIRHMGGLGQSSDPDGPAYHPDGLPLRPGLVEVITASSSAPGERHAHLAAYEGEVALFTWRGTPENPNTEVGGVGWIRAVEWMPYQRDTFVSPPFAGYTSGHSTFSRAAAEVLAAFTGSPFFPGGMSSFTAPAQDFLEFERGPTEDVTLTWATYFDAADEAGISRLYGGIHVRADDLQGRVMGAYIGRLAFAAVTRHFRGAGATSDPDAAFAQWVEAMRADPLNPSRAEDYHDAPDRALAEFFFGASEASWATRSDATWVGLDEARRHAQIRFLSRRSLLPPQWQLETSSDLREWKSISPEQVQRQDTPLGEGWVETRLRDPEPLSAGNAPRFYRVTPAEDVE